MAGIETREVGVHAALADYKSGGFHAFPTTVSYDITRGFLAFDERFNLFIRALFVLFTATFPIIGFYADSSMLATLLKFGYFGVLNSCSVGFR